MATIIGRKRRRIKKADQSNVDQNMPLIDQQKLLYYEADTPQCINCSRDKNIKYLNIALYNLIRIRVVLEKFVGRPFLRGHKHKNG